MPYAKRDILPGFPKEMTFSTREEVNKYLSGEKVQCLRCGRSFKILDTHLRKVHEMDSDDYREAYGLPYQRGLCGANFSARRSEHGREIYANHTDRQKAAIEKARAAQTAAGGNPQRNKPLFWRNEVKQQWSSWFQRAKVN